MLSLLTFKNEKLRSILKITEESRLFQRTYYEAIEAYEKDKGKTYESSFDLTPYYETNIPTLWFVKDEGIYLMPTAKLQNPPKDKSHICYAEGFEPDNPDCWELCRNAVGGDDFVETGDFNEHLKNAVRKGADIIIEVTLEAFFVSTKFPK